MVTKAYTRSSGVFSETKKGFNLTLINLVDIGGLLRTSYSTNIDIGVLRFC